MNRTKETMMLIDARDKPNKVKFTSLQLIVFCFSCFKISCLVKPCCKFCDSHTIDSLKKPCSIPK